MPPGRPPKRPSDGDSPLDSPRVPKMKMARLDRGPEDFSSVVKSKLQSYSRTGQACDRCKVRKIKCDALPEGCSHCSNQSLECYVTDRVTGRTERRGYMQQLEREKADMVAHIRSLERLLENNGVEVQPFQGPSSTDSYPSGITYDSLRNPVPESTPKSQWSQFDAVWVKSGASKLHNSQGSTYTRAALLESRPPESYLGVTADSAPLSSIKGTTLSILGMTIDITSFDAPDIDEPQPGTPIGSPLYNKSVMAFMQSCMGINPPLENVDLPSRHDAFTYAEWYFLMVFPFLPVLHKPSFLKLLKRVYDEKDFTPSTPELVTIHMVFATIYFQYGIRNPEETEKRAQLNELSNKHYHFCLNKLFYLCTSPTLEAVQGLTMIALHTRSFPKPGCSSSIANFTFSKAIEMNLHRAVKMPSGTTTTLDNEIRKRTWWAILALVVTLNGRLGRPMPIALEEFDTEFPLAIPDDCLSEEGVLDPSRIGHCDYLVGLMGMKVTPLYLEMYSNIYSVRRDPKKYVDVVRSLEDWMRSLQETLPDDLKMENCRSGNQIFALYSEAFCLELTLCLRHPSVCMTDDPKFCAENTRLCEEAAKKLLKVLGSLLKVRCLDTTWYQLSVYLAAIFSMLVAHWERRYHTTAFEIATLRKDMALWLNIISEVGLFLGTGTNLTAEVSGVIERTIAWIEQDMNRKDGTPPNQPQIKHQSTSPFSTSIPGKLTSHNSTSTNSSPPSDQRNSASHGNSYYETVNGSTPYPSLAFADQSSNTTAAGAASADSNGLSGAGSYDLGDSTAQYMYASATNNSNGVEHTSPTQNPLVAFASQATQHVASTQGDDWRQTAAESQLMAAAAAAQVQAQAVHSGNTWHNWTAAIADSHDRYSANALLTLGATAPRGAADAMAAGTALGGHAADMSALGAAASSLSGHASQWPLLLFHDGTGVSGA